MIGLDILVVVVLVVGIIALPDKKPLACGYVRFLSREEAGHEEIRIYGRGCFGHGGDGSGLVANSVVSLCLASPPSRLIVTW